MVQGNPWCKWKKLGREPGSTTEKKPRERTQTQRHRQRDTDKETQTKRRAFRLEKKPGWATEETLGRNPKDIKTLGWDQARQQKKPRQKPKAGLLG